MMTMTIIDNEIADRWRVKAAPGMRTGPWAAAAAGPTTMPTIRHTTIR